MLGRNKANVSAVCVCVCFLHWVGFTEPIENPSVYVVCCVEASKNCFFSYSTSVKLILETLLLDLVLRKPCGRFFRRKSDQILSLIGYHRRLMAVMCGCMV